MADELLFEALPNNWELSSLGEVCKGGGGNIQTGPFGSQLHAADYVPHGIPSIMPQNIGDNRVIENGIARITPEDASRLSRYLVRSGDIVYSRRGDVERRALIRDHENGWLCGTGCLRVRFGGNVNPQFASFYLGHPVVRQWIVRHAHGATMPNLNTSILSELPFVVPPLSEQRAIAQVLGTLDDKIELNRKMSQTLEAMARAIFKSWFVDFDPVRAKAEGRDPGLPPDLTALFPDGFEDSELGEIPKGWSTSSVYDLATYINGAAYRAFEPNEERSGLPIIKIMELKAGVTSQTRFSTVDMPNKYKIDTGDILFSWSGNPDTSIDIFVWPHGPAWLNQHIFRVVPRSVHERAFVLMALRSLLPMFAEVARNKQTTGLGHVTVADLKRLVTVRPTESILLGWNVLVEPMLDRSFGLEKEIKNFAALRDALLPKLLSGEIKVHAAEMFMEKAG